MTFNYVDVLVVNVSIESVAYRKLIDVIDKVAPSINAGHTSNYQVIETKRDEYGPVSFNLNFFFNLKRRKITFITINEMSVVYTLGISRHENKA